MRSLHNGTQPRFLVQRRLGAHALAAAGMWAAVCAHAGEKPMAAPGCPHESAQQCVTSALEAMGGRDRLQQVTSIRLQTVGHTLLMEQSYRQAPFITSYERDHITLDLANQRLLTQAKLTWPESDPNQYDSDTTLVAGPDGGVYRTKFGDSPCSLADLDAARQALALGPARVLLTAAAASDLHFERPETLRSTSHAVIAFTWRQIPVRVLLNPFNHLPDAVETTRVFHDFWYFWGDVRQRIYFDNWKLVDGISYPTNWVEERNDAVWSSTQVLEAEFNVAVEAKDFEMNPGAVKQSAASPGWNRPFSVKQATPLAPGVDLYAGSWNSTVVKEPDGIVILEAPISGTYTQGVMKEARRRHPGMPISAVLSTSDSWPHTGGVRQAVALDLPVYILDLNRPLLDRMMSAPHTQEPDALQKAAHGKTPHWKIVSSKQEVGGGANRMELYPLRGASTERQYMVYFPEHHLLYASDTLAINDDGSLYDPELMHEVAQAVKRENLIVDTVYAMHQGPMPWEKVLELIEKSQHP
ncbi:MAG: MBL fold metallo-hydrolase [Steroidobacteraceae bacterium]